MLIMVIAMKNLHLLIGVLVTYITIGILARILVKLFSFLLGDKPKVNEFSYQRYAKFYDNIALADAHFLDKISKITDLINSGYRDIKEIAELTGCNLDECIIKIRYLQNKKQFKDLHVDKKNYKLLECSKEEVELIKKYTPYIYYNHFNIDEITTRIRKSAQQDFNKLREQVYNEIIYLYENDLINGIRINEVDKDIIYYSVEKRKNRDLITINCPNCGALNDINRGSKVRCEYCDTIIDDTEEK